MTMDVVDQAQPSEDKENSGKGGAAQPNPDHPFKVGVAYNGVEERFEVRPDELVSKLLEQAVHKFGPIPNPHTLALYNSAGKELSDSASLKAAGVKPDDHLLLRPSQVKGG